LVEIFIKIRIHKSKSSSEHKVLALITPPDKINVRSSKARKLSAVASRLQGMFEISHKYCRVCHRFRLIKRYDYFWVNFDRLNKVSFLEAVGEVLKIGSSLKANHHQEI